MITWATTVAPQTTAVTCQTTSEVRPAGPGAQGSITQTSYIRSTASEMWSQTVTSAIAVINPREVDATVTNSGFTILGTTDSTIWATNDLGNPTNGSVTRRSVVNQTSTQTTREYTYRTTQTQTSAATTLGSTVIDGNTTVGSFVPTTLTYTSTFTEGTIFTTNESCLSTTTVTAETVATPIFATVIVADKNEVIWVADTTAATNLSGLRAASAVATSTTRTTIMPWTATVAAMQANTTETTAVGLPLISTVIPYSAVVSAAFSSTVVQDYQFLPHQTSVLPGSSRSLSATSLSTTLAPAETIVKTKSAGTETILVASVTTARAFVNGSSFATSASRTGTISREHTLPTAESSTYTMTEEVVAYSIPETWTDTSEWTEYTWTASYQYTTSNSLTTFARLSQGIATSTAEPLTSYEARVGVVESDGNLSLGYTLNSTLGSGFGATSVSRHASSAWPSSGEFTTLYPETGEPTNVSVNVSRLSVSVSFPGPISTTTTTTRLSAFGSALSVQNGPGQWRSALSPAGLGKSETLFATLPEGVYSTGTVTFSTSGKTASFASGETSSSAAPLPVSFIAPAHSLAGANKIWWTVSRNSHPSMAALTAAAAYSAS